MDDQIKLHQKTEMIISTNLLIGDGMTSADTYTSLKNFLNTALLETEGTGIYEYGGLKMICGYSKMINLPWMVFAEKLK